MKQLLKFVKKGNLYVVSSVGYLFGVLVFLAWLLVSYLIFGPDKLNLIHLGGGPVAMFFFFGLNGIMIIMRREIPYIIPATIKGLPAVLFGYMVLILSWSLMGYFILGILRYRMATGHF